MKHIKTWQERVEHGSSIYAKASALEIEVDELLLHERQSMIEKEADWKAIALALGQRVNFAVQQCDCKGGGMFNTETGQITGWRDYMAEALQMIPGVVIDREILATLNLPAAKRKKAQAEIKASREAAYGIQGGAA